MVIADSMFTLQGTIAITALLGGEVAIHVGGGDPVQQPCSMMSAHSFGGCGSRSFTFLGAPLSIAHLRTLVGFSALALITMWSRKGLTA